MAAANAIQAPSQYAQSSRKGKKAWRKNVDLTEIEAGLEEVREEKIAGGVLRELPSESLFTTDLTGSTALAEVYTKKHKPLKADEILAQRSAIPSVSARKRAFTTDDASDSDTPRRSAVGDGIMRAGASEAKRRKGGGVSAKRYEELRRIAYGGETVRKDVVTVGGKGFDPWAVDGPGGNGSGEFSFLEEKRPVREPVTLKHKPVSMARDGREISAVRKPEGGKSYNPVFEDWMEVVKREEDKAVGEEMRRLEEKRLEEEKEEMVQRVWAEEEEKEKWESEWESEWEGIESGKEELPEWMKPRKLKRKTQAERNSIARHKGEERKRKEEKERKRRENKEHHVKAFAKQVAKEDKLRKEIEQEKMAMLASISDEENGNEIPLLKRRFGEFEPPKQPLEVVLPEELEDSLRRLKPEGNLLTDRFRSMILRGKIEARRTVPRKKPRKPTTEKWSYKDWKLI